MFHNHPGQWNQLGLSIQMFEPLRSSLPLNNNDANGSVSSLMVGNGMCLLVHVFHTVLCLMEEEQQTNQAQAEISVK